MAIGHLLENLPNAHPCATSSAKCGPRAARSLSTCLVFTTLSRFPNTSNSPSSARSGRTGGLDRQDQSKPLRAAGAPKMADAERLRTALGEGFLTTATYAAASGKLALKISLSSRRTRATRRRCRRKRCGGRCVSAARSNWPATAIGMRSCRKRYVRARQSHGRGQLRCARRAAAVLCESRHTNRISTYSIGKNRARRQSRLARSE